MVKIVTQNVRGLQNEIKRRSIFTHLRQKADVICIQETHGTLDNENLWRNQWGGKAFWSHGESNARGVAILIKKDSELDILDSFSDKEGRIVGVQCTYRDIKYVILNCYAPNDDVPLFWTNALKLFEDYDGKRILLGDLNTALDKGNDRSNINAKNNDRCAQTLNEYLEETYLCDVWRERNNEAKVYTFCTRRPNFIGSRLDYILVDRSIAGWVSDIKMIAGFRSDHSGVLMQLDPFNIMRGRGYWKLNTKVLFEMDYVNAINAIIENSDHFNQHMNDAEKWETLKLHVIAESQIYCQNRASNRKLIISQLEQKIEEYEKLNRQNSLNSDDEMIFKRTKSDYEELMTEKTQGAIFRSGARYYVEGEKSTKYFFQLEKHRAGAKGMNTLIMENGEEIHDQNRILHEQFLFYKKLYTADPNICFDYKNTSNIKITNEQKNSLDGLFTQKELHEAIFGLKRGKCSGCDGIPAEFYAIFYEKIKMQLLNTFNYCYEVGELFPSALRGVINLIPKKLKDSRKISSMRPISLLSSDYKLVEKILANRLKPVLNDLIDQDQKGFLPNRKIHCNIRRVLDIVQLAEEEDFPGLIVSIDFAKCFDTIEIPSLIKALDYFGVGDSYKRWTKLLYNNPIACVSNNGHFSPYFKISRSVRQGGPNSAYYFLVLAEVLAIELRKNPKIQGIMVNQLKRLLGQYADDIDLYLYGNERSVQAAFDTIIHFEKRSGFRISYEKTTLYRIGSIKKSQEKFYTNSMVSWTNEKTNILGVDIVHDSKKLTQINYLPLIKKAEGILYAWGNRSLSLYGKIMIVNVLVASLFVYKMSVLPTIPESIIKALNKVIERFIWNGRRPKIKLEILQISKQNGGAGLVNFEYKDMALKSAWLQSLLTDKLIEVFAYNNLNKYLKELIWAVNIVPDDVNKCFKKGFWTDVLYAWSRLKNVSEAAEVEPINQIIWYNSKIRIAGKPIFIERAFKNGLIYVSQLISIEKEYIPTNIISTMYNLTLLESNAIITCLKKEWKDLIKGQIEVCDTEENRKFYEYFIAQRKCTAHCYSKLCESQTAFRSAYKKWSTVCNFYGTYENFCELFKNIYIVTTNAKLRSFQFRLLHNAIIMNDKLFRWKIKNSNICQMCNMHKETTVHFFIECVVAKGIWRKLQQYCETICKSEECTISPFNVISNLVNPKPGHIFNFFVLVAKSTMYSMKCLGEPISFEQIENQIGKYRRYEYFYSVSENKTGKHITKWLICDEQNNVNYNGTGFSDESVQHYVNLL